MSSASVVKAESFGAYVIAALFDRAGLSIFVLADGQVVFEQGDSVQVSGGAGILFAAADADGLGVIVATDDGRVLSVTRGGEQEIARDKSGWIDALAVAPSTGLIAYAAGKTVTVRDAKDPAFVRVFEHERSVADLAFDPKGRRLAAATYGGLWLWYARIEGQKPTVLKYTGSHIGAVFSNDGRFVISAMQENALHAWRLSDNKDMHMSGYPSKTKSFAFIARGNGLATSGASGAVVWPFTGNDGPMGKSAQEIHPQDNLVVKQVASDERGALLAGGLDSGQVWLANLAVSGLYWLKTEAGAAISALSLDAKGARAAFGDEAGGAWVVELSPV